MIQNIKLQYKTHVAHLTTGLLHNRPNEKHSLRTEVKCIIVSLDVQKGIAAIALNPTHYMSNKIIITINSKNNNKQ